MGLVLSQCALSDLVFISLLSRSPLLVVVYLGVEATSLGTCTVSMRTGSSVSRGGCPLPRCLVLLQ